MRILSLGLTATVAALAFSGCGAAKRTGQATKVIVEPTVVGVNTNCPDATPSCAPIAERAREYLKQEVKPLEHNCPKGYDLLITLPSSSSCVPESKIGATTKLTTTLPGVGAGTSVLAQSGCLACHKIGSFGNSGPGPDLTYVGSALSAARIKHALFAPQPPMPSFRSLSPQKLKALVVFLSLLRRPARGR